MKKNARQHVSDVYSKLQCSKDCLNEALETVEKPTNKHMIEQTLSAVENAIHSANSTLENYTESPK